MRWHHEIPDNKGQISGHFDAAICTDEQELDECIRFSALPGGFERYRRHMLLEKIWPMAVLIDIEVDPEKWHRGIGRWALSEFYGQAVQKGAVAAIGRVGWPPTDDWEDQRDRNLRIYQKAGWVFFPRQGLEPYFIYRDLATKT